MKTIWFFTCMLSFRAELCLKNLFALKIYLFVPTSGGINFIVERNCWCYIKLWLKSGEIAKWIRRDEKAEIAMKKLLALLKIVSKGMKKYNFKNNLHKNELTKGRDYDANY